MLSFIRIRMSEKYTWHIVSADFIRISLIDALASPFVFMIEIKMFYFVFLIEPLFVPIAWDRYVCISYGRLQMSKMKEEKVHNHTSN